MLPKIHLVATIVNHATLVTTTALVITTTLVTTITQDTTTIISNCTMPNVVPKETSNTIRSHPTPRTTVLSLTTPTNLIRSVLPTPQTHQTQTTLVPVHCLALSLLLCAPCTHAVVDQSTHHFVQTTIMKDITYMPFTIIPTDLTPTYLTPTATKTATCTTMTTTKTSTVLLNTRTHFLVITVIITSLKNQKRPSLGAWSGPRWTDFSIFFVFAHLDHFFNTGYHVGLDRWVSFYSRMFSFATRPSKSFFKYSSSK